MKTGRCAGPCGLPDGVSSLEPGARVEFALVPPHLAGKAHQARIIRVVSEAEAA